MSVSYLYKRIWNTVFFSHRSGVVPLHWLPKRSKAIMICTGRADLAFYWNTQVQSLEHQILLGREMKTSLFLESIAPACCSHGKYTISHVWDLESYSNQLSNNHCLLFFLFLEVWPFESSKPDLYFFTVKTLCFPSPHPAVHPLENCGKRGCRWRQVKKLFSTSAFSWSTVTSFPVLHIGKTLYKKGLTKSGLAQLN